MKNYSFYSVFIKTLSLTVFLLSQSIVSAQVTLSHAKNGIPGQQEGFFYSLPQTVLKVDFILKKTNHTAGPYSSFATRMLGVEDFVQNDHTSYEIVDAIVGSVTEPDSKAVFFVRFDERAAKDAASIIFSQQPNGILLGAGDAVKAANSGVENIEKLLVNAPDEKRFSYYAERNLYRRIDTIIRNITIDTTIIKRPVLHASWVDRTPEQKARAAADYIQTIRESRYNLISGYQEINYGQTMVYMDQQLKQLEEAYLSLFLGQEHSTLEEFTVYFTPQKNDEGIKQIARFSDETGIQLSGSKGTPLQLELIAAGNTKSIPSVDENSLESVTVINSMIYRIAETVEIRVTYQGRLLAQDRLPISQMGAIAVAPLNRTKLTFDPNTGQVIQLKRD
ncbi:MAG: DUF4831 family protein [Bacteroidetes bacterium]|nr:DUF4831 family protein [Bacteroidota bacterium]MBU1579783.1 DUF4831 family protein [Bacteroidota bacterium]MBU2465528.1 DUF4831 family protein [Bacteroidota bacterium]MBU2556615.1 DUF4831 family protein [Bacteroidota bacterium]